MLVKAGPRFSLKISQSHHILKSHKVAKKVFLCCVKPHNPMEHHKITRWLKTVIEKAGIDVNKYKAHSVRGASTSKANKMDLWVGPIFLQRANWGIARAFYRFYNRGLQHKDEFQNKVLPSNVNSINNFEYTLSYPLIIAFVRYDRVVYWLLQLVLYGGTLEDISCWPGRRLRGTRFCWKLDRFYKLVNFCFDGLNETL